MWIFLLALAETAIGQPGNMHV
ncbi:hypothetical protein BM590_A2081 [Brucella melitensis M5-90]|nr:hypothetical protein BM590_A2081 [Brucella melitensis M5-90]